MKISTQECGDLAVKSMPFTDGVDKNALYALLEPGNTYKIKTSGTRIRVARWQVEEAAQALRGRWALSQAFSEMGSSPLARRLR